jgi:hypothetical protein
MTYRPPISPIESQNNKKKNWFIYCDFELIVFKRSVCFYLIDVNLVRNVRDISRVIIVVLIKSYTIYSLMVLSVMLFPCVYIMTVCLLE